MMNQPFSIVAAGSKVLPILLSVPHCGTKFPDELIGLYHPELIKTPDDTDWFVDQLYDFAADMGIAMIAATYSRWVIDLNRDPQSKPLYTDGRIITGLCPITDFLGNSLYKDNRVDIDESEVHRRLTNYYQPYHAQIQSMLDELKKKFKNVLLWDCHSIRQVVPTIQKEKFPDLILGDVDGTSASAALTQRTLQTLRNDKFSVSHNHPFKGGYITRHFGKPASGQHALQLEMTKINYMDDAELRYDKTRADRMRTLLMKTLAEVSKEL
jgi:N-formylglutamate deformylase